MAAAAVALPKEQRAPRTEREPLYRLVLFDDDYHSYQYVIEMMVNLFGMSQTQGFDIAYEVDHNGEATVKVCGLEEALLGREKIINYGADPAIEGSVGSMTAVVLELE